jgi:type VI secretion system protein ImpC
MCCRESRTPSGIPELPFILAISRFAHYTKGMMRDKISSFMSRSERQAFLSSWILQYMYVVMNDYVSLAIWGRRPLAETSIEIAEVAGSSACAALSHFSNRTSSWIQPPESLRLVAEPPQGASNNQVNSGAIEIDSKPKEGHYSWISF